MKRLFTYLFFAGYIVSVPFDTQASETTKCASNATQIDLDMCTQRVFDEADKKLNKIYTALLKKQQGDAVFVKEIRAAQLAWNIFRDAELKARFACAQSDAEICWGHDYPRASLERNTILTLERIRQLEQLFDDGPGS